MSRFERNYSMKLSRAKKNNLSTRDMCAAQLFASVRTHYLLSIDVITVLMEHIIGVDILINLLPEKLRLLCLIHFKHDSYQITIRMLKYNCFESHTILFQDSFLCSNLKSRIYIGIELIFDIYFVNAIFLLIILIKQCPLSRILYEMVPLLTHQISVSSRSL